MATHDVPFLRAGEGITPQNGGCIMQIVDWIHRGGWTDSPKCVHPIIRTLSIEINDALNDEDRQRLLDLTPRLMGTAHGEQNGLLLGPEYDVEDPLYTHLFLYVLRAVVERVDSNDANKLFSAVEKLSEDPSNDMLFNNAADVLHDLSVTCSDDLHTFIYGFVEYYLSPAISAYDALSEFAVQIACDLGGHLDLVDFLKGFLDVFEQHGGRREDPVDEIDWAPVCQVMQPV